MNKLLKLACIALLANSCILSMPKPYLERNRRKGLHAQAQKYINSQLKNIQDIAAASALTQKIIRHLQEETKRLEAKMDAPIDHFTSPRHYTPEAKEKRRQDYLADRARWDKEQAVIEREFGNTSEYQDAHGKTVIDLTSAVDRNPEWASYHLHSTLYYGWHEGTFAKLDQSKPNSRLQ